MKRILLALLVVGLLGGGYYVVTKKPSFSPTTIMESATSGAITSIQDAISQSLTLTCTYPDAQGNTMTTYIKGGTVRIVGYTMGPGQGQGNTLMKDNKMYIWDDVKKQGTVLALNMENIAQNAKDAVDAQKKDDAPSENTWKETLENLEKVKDSCKPGTVAESLFTVPTDVTFTDLNEQMNKAGIDVQKIIEDAKKQK